MKLCADNFTPDATGFSKDFIEMLGGLDERLKAILEKELELGNKISTVSVGWPHEGSVVVSLRNPLVKDHARPEGIYFEVPNDPKSWCYQYSNYNYVNDVVTHMLISGGD